MIRKLYNQSLHLAHVTKGKLKSNIVVSWLEPTFCVPVCTQTDYLDTTNATQNNKRCRNHFAVLGSKYLSGNNLPRINLIRAKLFPDRYLHPFAACYFNCAFCCQSRWLFRVTGVVQLLRTFYFNAINM